jgi:hypothetical protein
LGTLFYLGVQQSRDAVGRSGWGFVLLFVLRCVFGHRGEEAEVSVEDDFVHRGYGFGGRRGLRQVEAGDLEAVEEKARAAGVDVVSRDALQHFADGLLDGAAVFRNGEVEGGAMAFADFDFRVADGAAGGVVVVAKFFVAERGTAATVSVGEDVAALKAGFRVAFGLWHGRSSPHRGFGVKYSGHGA